MFSKFKDLISCGLESLIGHEGGGKEGQWVWQTAALLILAWFLIVSIMVRIYMTFFFFLLFLHFIDHTILHPTSNKQTRTEESTGILGCKN